MNASDRAYLERYRQDQVRFRLIDASQPVTDVVDEIETQVSAYCDAVKDDD